MLGGSGKLVPPAKQHDERAAFIKKMHPKLLWNQ
jgi:hypothetical protein